ncbi:LOW QUALITY PROTEIN: hypothetical protein PHMEG_0001747 [Phytophthora megakarya]|uniref:Ubiquitin-like protease family profile domain-containing protein n=1 Tax=Phytophthora megakarya TaxID=4795 RepID=A0A225X212_9STRA|nr:LOW QUALITY PROTEIN: hypothetical protein PHMEG_0001747 [Phytophthora megakarya]
MVFLNKLESWPYSVFPGFGFDLAYSDVYCFMTSAWLNDNAVTAFGVVLSRYKNYSIVVLPPLAKKKKQEGMGILPAKTVMEIIGGIAAKPFVFLPVNFGCVHWACLVVDRQAKLVMVNDNLDKKSNKKKLKNVADEIGAQW